MKQNKTLESLLVFIIERLRNIKSLPLALLVTATCMFLCINCYVVISSLQKSIRDDFEEQLNILSNESRQIIESNYSILEGIVHNLLTAKQEDIINSFNLYTQKIGQYTPNTVLLADINHNIIALTTHIHSDIKNLSVANRDYIQNVLSTPEEIHIGHLVQGIATNIWSIPIVKGIFINNKHAGTVILSVPLTKFSEGLVKSDIILKKVQFGNNNQASFYYPEADSNAMANNSIGRKVSVTAILYSSLFGKADITISDIYEPLPNIYQAITLVMPAIHIQKLFFLQFIKNLGIFVLCILCMALMVFLIIRNLSLQLSNIEKKLLSSANKLQHLIPDYNVATFIEHTGHYDKMLANLSYYIDSNALVIDILTKQQNIILDKDKQLSILQRHFSACLGALREQSLSFLEEIEDICVNANKSAQNIIHKTLQTDNILFFAIFNKIYCCSKSYEEYLSSLQDTILRAQNIILGKKEIVSVENILRYKFASRYNKLIVTKYPSLVERMNSNAHTLPHIKKTFFIAAVESSIETILTLSKSCNITLHEDNISLKIEIAFDIDEYSPSNNIVQHSIEKARLYALLDDGFVSIYRSEHTLVITIVYSSEPYNVGDNITFKNENILLK